MLPISFWEILYLIFTDYVNAVDWTAIKVIAAHGSERSKRIRFIFGDTICGFYVSINLNLFSYCNPLDMYKVRSCIKCIPTGFLLVSAYVSILLLAEEPEEDDESRASSGTALVDGTDAAAAAARPTTTTARRCNPLTQLPSSAISHALLAHTRRDMLARQDIQRAHICMGIQTTHVPVYEYIYFHTDEARICDAKTKSTQCELCELSTHCVRLGVV